MSCPHLAVDFRYVLISMRVGESVSCPHLAVDFRYVLISM